jgi:hypothetical protein
MYIGYSRHMAVCVREGSSAASLHGIGSDRHGWLSLHTLHQDKTLRMAPLGVRLPNRWGFAKRLTREGLNNKLALALPRTASAEVQITESLSRCGASNGRDRLGVNARRQTRGLFIGCNTNKRSRRGMGELLYATNSFVNGGGGSSVLQIKQMVLTNVSARFGKIRVSLANTIWSCPILRCSNCFPMLST